MNWLDPLLKKIFKIREDSNGEVVKPFLDHLEDLRWTLLKMIGTLGAGMILSFVFRQWLFAVMVEPLKVISEDPTRILQFTGPADSIMVSLTLAFYAGIVLTFPILLFYLLEFILPALTRQEKKYIVPGIILGFGLFIGGVLACYHFLLPQTMKWLYADSLALKVTPQWRVTEYFSFVTRLTLGFGLLTEVPPVMTVLGALGIVSHRWLVQTRPYAIVMILVMSAFIAPTPDPMTLLMLGVPVIAFYEVCIWIIWLLERRREKRKRKDDGF